MTINLTQKERMLLQDQLNHEKLCIQKYSNYANQARDPQLKQLFKTYAGQEQQHYNTINQMLNGQAPSMVQQPGQQAGGLAQGNMPVTMSGRSDEELCNDMLVTEKYISGAYDTAIFEFRDSNMRQALNHIQKEEQQHGEGIFNYMQGKGMYNP